MNNEQVQEIFIEDIIPNRFQPRLTFDEKALKELSDSIKVHGVIQPLVLRKVGNKYEIIAGERRYKASCIAGLKKVPAIVREMTDNESAEVALIENVQRKNLSSIEEAQSYKNLLDRGYLTQGDLASKIGVSQPTIANKMRLLNLCDEVQNALLNEQISERHARSLLQLSNPDDQKNMLNRVIKERLTVKQLDVEIKKMLSGENDSGEEVVLTPVKSLQQEEMENMNNLSIEQDNTNEPIVNKNIFGFNIDTPTDLESSAPNLNIGEEEDVSPISFNPFTSSSLTSSLDEKPTFDINEAAQEEQIETFDMFGDIVAPSTKENESLLSNIEQSPKNIGDQISSVREAVKKVEDSGFRVELEEYDFSDMYQIVVKIKK